MVVLTILKNMKVNGKDDIPYIMENIIPYIMENKWKKYTFETTNQYIYISYQSCTHSIRVPSFGVLPSQHALSGNKVKAHKRRRTIGERISCGFPVSMDGLKGISGKFLTSNIVSCKLFVEQSPAWSEMVQPILARATNRLWYGWTMTSVAFNKPKKTLEEYPGSYFHRNMGISLAT